MALGNHAAEILQTYFRAEFNVLLVGTTELNTFVDHVAGEGTNDPAGSDRQAGASVSISPNSL
jgi:hypothetical protein